MQCHYNKSSLIVVETPTPWIQQSHVSERNTSEKAATGKSEATASATYVEVLAIPRIICSHIELDTHCCFRQILDCDGVISLLFERVDKDEVAFLLLDLIRRTEFVQVEMGCLEFEVIPEVSLRNEHVEFVLGMSLCQTIAALQNAARYIRNIELTYSHKDPLSRDITITLASDGIRLVFDPKCQQLKLIEIYDLSHIALRYCSSVFSKPSDQATVAKVESSFGATHPGVYDKKLKVYTLSWRGLSFCFSTANEVSASQQSPFAHGLGSLQFPNGSSPVVAKMYIFNGATLADAKVVDMPIECYGGNNRLLSVRTVKSYGSIVSLVFTFSAETTGTQSLSNVSIANYTRTVSFGDTEETVLSALGSPSRVFFKSEDKMRIHRPSGERIREPDGTDFFYNYFSMGFDLLFDCRTRRAKKFVLHTNYPGHFDFGIYSRCNFEIELESIGRFEDAEVQAEKGLLTAFSKFENFSNIICECDSDKRTSAVQPVVLNRTSSSGVENPFGSTFCYGCGQLIIEVMSNGHIASVTIFKQDASI